MRIPIKLALYGTLFTIVAFGACLWSIVDFSKKTYVSMQRNKVLDKYETKARKNLETMKQIGGELPYRFSQFPSDRELQLTEKIRLSERLRMRDHNDTVDSSTPLPDYNAVCISETALKLLADDWPAVEERDGHAKWVSRIASNFFDKYGNANPADDVELIFKDRLNSSIRRLEMMLHLMAEAKYVVVIRTKILKPTSNDAEIKGDVLVYEMASGEYLGAAPFHAFKTEGVDYGGKWDDEVPAYDFITNARNAIQESLDESVKPGGRAKK